MEPWQAIVLGLVEGLTEFLPVSSTGHLLIAQRLFGIPQSTEANAFLICIQAGAIVAVLALYGRRIAQTVRGIAGQDPEGARLFRNLVVAFVPAAVIGKLLDEPIEEILFGPWPVVAAWLAGGIVILAVAGRPALRGSGAQSAQTSPDADAPAPDALPPPAGGLPLEALGLGPAAVIGLAQCLALWPGTSRSLVTLLAGVFVGLSLPAAVEFSFLLGLLTLGAATVYKGLQHGPEMLAAYGPLPLALGFVAAAVSAFGSARWMVAHLSKHGLAVFGWWRIVAALLVAGLLVSGRLA